MKTDLQKKVGAIIMIGIIIFGLLMAFYQKNSLKKNLFLTSGNIYEFGNSNKNPGQIFFKFKFSLDNVIYHGNSGIPCKVSKIHFQSWRFGKKIQVVYDKTDPDNCEALLSKENYNEFGLQIPDEYQTQTKLIDSLYN